MLGLRLESGVDLCWVKQASPALAPQQPLEF